VRFFQKRAKKTKKKVGIHLEAWTKALFYSISSIPHPLIVPLQQQQEQDK
jgi:hypothetical protein